MEILIFGSGPGLSRGIAQLFGQKGFSVSLVSRNEEKLKQEVSELKALKIAARYTVADVGDEKQMSTFLDTLRSSENLADVIVFNAFAAQQKGFAEENWDSIKKQLDVNVGGAFNLAKSVLPIMQQKNKGKLFFTGGIFGIEPHPDFLGLSVGKAAMRNLAQAAAKKVEGTNVHVGTVTVSGYIGGPDPKYAPLTIAEEYWKLYIQPQGKFQTEVIY